MPRSLLTPCRFSPFTDHFRLQGTILGMTVVFFAFRQWILGVAEGADGSPGCSPKGGDTELLRDISSPPCHGAGEKNNDCDGSLENLTTRNSLSQLSSWHGSSVTGRADEYDGLSKPLSPTCWGTSEVFGAVGTIVLGVALQKQIFPYLRRYAVPILTAAADHFLPTSALSPSLQKGASPLPSLIEAFLFGAFHSCAVAVPKLLFDALRNGKEKSK